MARTWWRPPRLRVGESEEADRRATWLELFYDLIFVVAVIELGHKLDRDVTLSSLGAYVVLFIPVWWAWVGATLYANRFDADDVAHRLLAALQMLGIAGLAANVHDGLGETSRGFALSYVIVRAVLILQYRRAGRHLPAARTLTGRYSCGFAIAAAIWLVSVFVPEPLRFFMWAVALVVDFGTPLTARRLQVTLPPAASHLPERFGLFVIIVLGEMVAAIVEGLANRDGGAPAMVTAALGLLIALSFWWMYFESVDASVVKRVRVAGQVWLYTHLPLVMGLAAIGAGVRRIVSHDPIIVTGPDRWLLGGSIALSLVAMATIHFTSRLTLTWSEGRREVGYRMGAAVGVLGITALGAGMPPLLLMTMLVGLCVVQVLLDLVERVGT